MKSYTDIEQSKKLAEILPIESADMRYERVCFDRPPEKCWYVKLNPPFKSDDIIPCWSLAALLGLMPFHLIVNNQRYAFSMHKGLNKDGETYMFRYNVFNTDVCLHSTDYYNNSVDAAFEMVCWLKENNEL